MYFLKELKMDLEYSCAKHRPLTIPQKHIGNTLKMAMIHFFLFVEFMIRFSFLMEKNFQMIWIEIKKNILILLKDLLLKILYNQQMEYKSNSNLL